MLGLKIQILYFMNCQLSNTKINCTLIFLLTISLYTFRETSLSTWLTIAFHIPWHIEGLPIEFPFLCSCWLPILSFATQDYFKENQLWRFDIFFLQLYSVHRMTIKNCLHMLTYIACKSFNASLWTWYLMVSERLYSCPSTSILWDLDSYALRIVLVSNSFSTTLRMIYKI